MNQFTLTGKVIEKDKITVTAAGTEMIRFKVACDKTKENDPMYSYDVFTVAAFREIAKLIDKNVEEGTVISIAGRLSANNYERDGRAYFNVNLVASNFEIFK